MRTTLRGNPRPIPPLPDGIAYRGMRAMLEGNLQGL
jgi:hypothetical protein